MFPLADASRRQRTLPVVTVAIVALNAFAFMLELAGGEDFVLRWALVANNITAGRDWITFLTSMFLHGSWSHIIGNMIFLWAFGPEIEDAMGPARYAVFYLVGGVAAMTAQIAGDPHSTIPALGASGAIAAVMGAFLGHLSARPDPHDRLLRHFLSRHLHTRRAADRPVVLAPACQSGSGQRRGDADRDNGGVSGAYRRRRIRRADRPLVRGQGEDLRRSGLLKSGARAARI